MRSVQSTVVNLGGRKGLLRIMPRFGHSQDTLTTETDCKESKAIMYSSCPSHFIMKFLLTLSLVEPPPLDPFVSLLEEECEEWEE